MGTSDEVNAQGAREVCVLTYRSSWNSPVCDCVRLRSRGGGGLVGGSPPTSFCPTYLTPQ